MRLFVSQLSFTPFYAYLLEQDRSKDAHHTQLCDAALASIERAYGAHSASGPYFLGQSLSAADVAVLPFVDRFAAGLHAHRGYCILGAECGDSKAPRLARAYAEVQSRPAWRATSQPAAFYVSAYEGYASGKPGVPRRVRSATPEVGAYVAVKS